MQRRDFMKTSAGLAAMGIMGADLDASESRRIPFALQINSIAPFAAKGFPAAMKRVKAMGFKGVEFAGYYGKTASYLKSVLDDLGLETVGAHLGLKDLLAEKFEKTAAFHKSLGNRNLVIGHGLDKINSTELGARFSADLVNEVAYKASKCGMFVFYHNHETDFAPVGKSNAFDTFFGFTSDNVFMQLDTSNAILGGADPYALLEKYPKKQKVIHLKAAGPDGTTVKDSVDSVDWKRVFNFCENVAKTEWYILEQYPKKGEDHFVAVEKSMNEFKKMGKL